VDIGEPGIAGSDDYASSGAFTLTGSGTGLTNWYQGNTNYYWNDQFHFVYTTVTGDFEMVARVTALGAALSQTGIALREDLTPSARSATIFYSPASSSDSPPKDVIQATVRMVGGVQNPPNSYARVNPWPTRPNPAALPVWLKIVRIAGDVGQYWSRDGEVWIPVPTGGAFVPTGPVSVGMYVASNGQTSSATSTFDNVYVGPPRLRWKTSWIGNSFNQPSQGNLASYFHDGYVTADLNALWVAKDGSCWTNSGWDEGGQSMKIYKDDGHGGGRVVKTLTDNGYFGNNDAHEGSITSDGTYTYVLTKSITNRIHRADANGAYNAEMSFSPPLGDVAGMAASGPNHELYVSDVANNKIRVADTLTKSELPERAFDFTPQRPGPMAVDSRGNLWIIQEGNDFPTSHKYGTTRPTGIYCYTKDGSYTGSSITDIALPTALAIDPNQDRLLVTDNGPNQNVRIYDHLTDPTPTLSSTFGVTSGIYSGTNPGAIYDPDSGGMARFHSLTGVGVDLAGSIYVAGNARGSDLRKFDSSGQFVWSLHANGDTFGTGDFDPGTDGQDLFTNVLHYGLDYNQTAPGKEWSYKGFTANPFTNPDDPRLTASTVTYVRRLGPENRRFLFLSAVSGVIEIYRFSGPAGTGEIAIPAARISSIGDSKTKLWVDANADGIVQTSEETSIPSANGSNGSNWSTYGVDSAGDIWWLNYGILHFTMLGVSANGVPTYSLSGAGYSLAPSSDATSGSLRSIQYDRDHDALYLGGDTTVSTPGIGAVLTRYDNWSTTQSNPVARYRISMPSAETANDFYQQGPPWAYGVTPFIKSFDVAGDYLFTWDEFGQIRVYDAALGNPVINIGPGPEIGGITAWTDPAKAHAFKRANGEYELTMEDSGFMAKNLLYRWLPAAATVPAQQPTAFTALSDNGVIHLAWTGPRGQLTKYRVFRSTTSEAETLYADNVLTPSYDDTNITPGSRYFYKVAAVNAAGEGAQSNEASAANLIPNVSYVATDTTAQGNWKDSVYFRLGEYGYWIMGDTIAFPSWALVSSNGSLQSLAPAGTSDVRALQQPGAGTGRELFQLFKAAPYPSTGFAPFDIDLNLTDGGLYQVAVYVCDFYNSNY